MGIKKFEEFFEAKTLSFVSLKPLNHIISAMRENDVDKAVKLIKAFQPADGLFIRDEYLIDLASDFNQERVFSALYDRKKELKK